MKQIKYCEECDAIIRSEMFNFDFSDAKFCSNCGTALYSLWENNGYENRVCIIHDELIENLRDEHGMIFIFFDNQGRIWSRYRDGKMAQMSSILRSEFEEESQGGSK